jgi:hypothetical protein
MAVKVNESRRYDLPTRLNRFIHAGGEARRNLPDYTILNQEIKFSVQVVFG